ncbi:MAG: methytransferase partner Trm112 [Thermoplasmata archaeon]
MKRELMDILCCPVCKGDLELVVAREKDEILEGSLTCHHCDFTYEIEDGIPNLLPPELR